eukprot:m.166262 g.166262  ORF g.166262 m.166262 type:complete len:343 (+) comp25006_c0_seq6:56-1084(+)
MSDELLEIAQISVFLLALYVGGRVFALVNAQLIGEILIGMIWGKHVFNWLPYDDAIKLIGSIGLILLVMEGGLSLDLSRLQRVGMPAILIAVTGTILPCLLGWGFMSAIGKGGLEGLAAGTALSSTSIGMATKMLQALGYLQSHLGALISVAAMVDDILSLVILAVLSQVSDEDDTMSAGDKAWLILRPIIVSVCVIIGGLLCVRITPTCIKYLTRKFSDDHYDVIVLGVLLVSTAALTLGSGYAGSTHLLGSFAAGMSFSRVPHALELYIEHFQSMSELLTSFRAIRPCFFWLWSSLHSTSYWRQICNRSICRLVGKHSSSWLSNGWPRRAGFCDGRRGAR